MLGVKKGGQASSRTIMMLFALFALAVIILMGYRYAASTRQKGDAVLVEQAKNVFQSQIAAVQADFGSQKIVRLEMPRGVTEVCMVDLEDFRKSAQLGHTINVQGEPLLKDALESGTSQNVFLFGEGLVDSFYVENLRLCYPYYTCASLTSGKFETILKGRGSGALAVVTPSQRECQTFSDGGLCAGFEVLCDGDDIVRVLCNQHYGLC